MSTAAGARAEAGHFFSKRPFCGVGEDRDEQKISGGRGGAMDYGSRRGQPGGGQGL